MDKLYRYKDFVYADCTIHISLQEYPILRKTPKGFWIKIGEHLEMDEDATPQKVPDEKWVSASSKKRYAYPTKAAALHNLICRRQSQIDIMSSRIGTARQVIHRAKMLWKESGYADDQSVG